MKGKTLPYFLTTSPTMCQIKILILTFFTILWSFILLPYQTNKPLWYKLCMAFEAKLLSHYVFQSHTVWL